MAEYIDRDALMTALHSGNIDLGFVYKETYRKLREYSREVDKVIKSIPAADVAPVRRGRWSDAPDADDIYIRYRCSACGEDGLARYRFCPNCGAKMDEK